MACLSKELLDQSQPLLRRWLVGERPRVGRVVTHRLEQARELSLRRRSEYGLESDTAEDSPYRRAVAIWLRLPLLRRRSFALGWLGLGLGGRPARRVLELEGTELALHRSVQRVRLRRLRHRVVAIQLLEPFVAVERMSNGLRGPVKHACTTHQRAGTGETRRMATGVAMVIFKGPWEGQR